MHVRGTMHRASASYRMNYNSMSDWTPVAAGYPSRSQRDQELRAQELAATVVPVVEVQNLEKSYKTARGELNLFSQLNLRVRTGEMVAIVGQSGAGKSTLLHILGALDTPSSGKVYCASIDVAGLSPRQAAAFRNREIGYVWQFHYLLPEFTALENVAMPLMAGGVTRREALQTAANWLKEVGLEDRGDHRSGELSGGEQQRVAIARALVNHPRLLLADEPTGDLDAVTAERIFEVIERLHTTHGLTSILVTHNLELAARCRRILRLENGTLTELVGTSKGAGAQKGSRKSSESTEI